MKEIFINDAEDVSWLRSTHLPDDAPLFMSAVVHGNEDGPIKVDLYADQEPDVSTKPIRTYWFVSEVTPSEIKP